MSIFCTVCQIVDNDIIWLYLKAAIDYIIKGIRSQKYIVIRFRHVDISKRNTFEVCNLNVRFEVMIDPLKLDTDIFAILAALRYSATIHYSVK